MQGPPFTTPSMGAGFHGTAVGLKLGCSSAMEIHRAIILDLETFDKGSGAPETFGHGPALCFDGIPRPKFQDWKQSTLAALDSAQNGRTKQPPEESKSVQRMHVLSKSYQPCLASPILSRPPSQAALGPEACLQSRPIARGRRLASRVCPSKRITVRKGEHHSF